MATRRATDNGETGFVTGSRNRSNALDAFMTAKFQIDAMLVRLKALNDDHFETHLDEINWGHVGTLNHYARMLRQITDAAFKEDEHAA
jgi:hypothetical protein